VDLGCREHTAHRPRVGNSGPRTVIRSAG
jgi:hypothetical protein